MSVQTKDDLIELIFNLLDENDAIEWENDTAYKYLQRLAEWLEDNDIKQPTWQMIADAFEAARYHKK